MGERNWFLRYRTAREYADEQAEAYKRGDEISHWRQVSEHDTSRETLTGAAWVAWAYELAEESAKSLMHTDGKQWQVTVDECHRLAEEYRNHHGV